MKISPHYNQNAAGDLPAQEDERLRLTSSSSSGTEQCTLMLSPLEWCEIRNLVHFAKAAIEYDCEQDTYLFNHLGFPQYVTRDGESWQAALQSIREMPEQGSQPVELQMPRSIMREMFRILVLTMESEDRADGYYGGMEDDLQVRFPSLSGPSNQYSVKFGEALRALDAKKGATVDLHPPGM